MNSYTTSSMGASVSYENVKPADIESCLNRLAEAVFESEKLIRDIRNKVFAPSPEAQKGVDPPCVPITVSGHIEALARMIRDNVDILAHINGALTSVLGELKLV